MSEETLGGAINPYALTEAVIGKRVDWERLDRPLELVERTLGLPASQLFNPGKGSPVFALQKAVQQPGGVVAMAKATHSATERKRMMLDVSPSLNPALREKLADLLVPADPTLTETEYPNATWSDPGDFFEEGTEFGDPVQGAVGDCWLIAALSSVAWSRPYAILQRTRATGPNSEQFVDAVTFGVAPGSTKTFEVTENVPVHNGSGKPVFARSSEAGEIWPAVYEKAYARLRSGNTTDKPDIKTLHGGNCVDACVKLVPGLAGQGMATVTTSADDLWKALTANCISNPPQVTPTIFKVKGGRTVNPLTAWTYAKAEDAPDTIAYDATTGIVGWHCYSVLGWVSVTTLGIAQGPGGLPVQPQTHRYIVLRNPWGQHEGKVDVLSGDWTVHDRSWWRKTPLNTGGLFAMKIEAFKKYYGGLGIAK